MNSLEQGKNYTCQRYRSGTSQRGMWEVVVMTDNRSRNQITIFPRNMPCGVKEGQKFLVEDILLVKYGFRKDNNDRWQPQVTVDAVIKPIESEFDAGMTGAGNVDWSDLGSGSDDPWGDLDDLPL